MATYSTWRSSYIIGLVFTGFATIILFYSIAFRSMDMNLSLETRYDDHNQGGARFVCTSVVCCIITLLLSLGPISGWNTAPMITLAALLSLIVIVAFSHALLGSLKAALCISVTDTVFSTLLIYLG